MEYVLVHSNHDLSGVVKVLNAAHSTIAVEFGFTKENNPTNNAFIDEQTLKTQLEKGIVLYAMAIEGKIIGGEDTKVSLDADFFNAITNNLDGDVLFVLNQSMCVFSEVKKDYTKTYLLSALE